MLKQKLLNPILQAVFPLLVAEPPPGVQDPEDEDDNEDDADDNPKHCAAQVVVILTLNHHLESHPSLNQFTA